MLTTLPYFTIQLQCVFTDVITNLQRKKVKANRLSSAANINVSVFAEISS